MNQFKLGDFVYPKKLPWEEMLRDFIGVSVSSHQAATLLGVGQSTLQRWQKGTEPKHSYGVSIIILHTRFCGEELTRERINLIDRRSIHPKGTEPK